MLLKRLLVLVKMLSRILSLPPYSALWLVEQLLQELVHFLALINRLLERNLEKKPAEKSSTPLEAGNKTEGDVPAKSGKLRIKEESLRASEENHYVPKKD